MPKLRRVNKETLDGLADALMTAFPTAKDKAVCWACVQTAIQNCEAACEDGEVDELSPCSMPMDFSAPVPDMSSEVDPVEVKDVAERLIDAFSWASTPQGHDWWSKVYTRLVQIVDSVQAPVKEDREDKLDVISKEKLDALPNALISAFRFLDDRAVNWYAIHERLRDLRDGKKGPALCEKGLDSPVPFVKRPPNEAKKAADLLGNAFVWESTAEGWDFWAAVYERLLSFAAQPNDAEPEPEEAPATETLSFEY